MTPGDLVAEARTAARHAYAPYSNFAVGAALLLSDGTVIGGANMENASYGLSLCAETAALATASSQGRLAEVVAVAVVGGPIGADGTAHGAAAVLPCGRCRQMLNEAAALGGRDLAIHCAGVGGGAIETYRLSALLPHAFGPASLAAQAAAPSNSATPSG